MKKYFLLIAAVAAFNATASTYVEGYYKRDGTYVAPHWRSDSNGSRYDNWSSSGNVNPYTGSNGTRDPYQQKEYSPYQSPYKQTCGYTRAGNYVCK